MATTKALELAQLAFGIDVNANGEITNIGTLSSLDISGDISTSTLSASGDFTVDTNTFHVDAADNFVGIGTSTPSDYLHLDGDEAGSIRITLDNANASGFTTFRFQEDGNARAAFYYSNSSGTFNFQNAKAGGTFRMQTTDANNVTGTAITIDGDRNVTFSDGNVTVDNDLTVSGNFTVSGNTTFVNTDNLEIEDLNITLASGAANSAVADGAGITIDGANATLTYVASNDSFLVNKPFGVTRNGTEGAMVRFYDDGSQMGQIGTDETNSLPWLYIGSANTNIYFDGQNSRIYGINQDRSSNANIDLGTEAVPFKDLWLSNQLTAQYVDVVSSGTPDIRFYRNDTSINLNNVLGVITFGAEDDAGYENTAKIEVRSGTSNWGANNTPTEMLFYTTPASGGGSLITTKRRLLINQDGDVVIGQNLNDTLGRFTVSADGILNGGVMIDAVADDANGDSSVVWFLENANASNPLSGSAIAFNGSNSTAVSMNGASWSQPTNSLAIITSTGTATWTPAVTIDRNSGNIGMGTGSAVPQLGKLQVNDASGAILAITRTSGASTGELGIIRFGNTNIDSNLVNIVAHQDGAGDTGGLKFQTQSAGSQATDRLIINSIGDVSITSGNLYIGKADTASAHINSYEVMTFNIDVDNDDTDTRYFGWYKNGAAGSGTELMRLEENETTGLTVTGDITAEGEFRTSSDFPDVAPTLMLDFVNAKRLDNRITFTRSTSGTYWDGKTTTKAEENITTYSQDYTKTVSGGTGRWSIMDASTQTGITAPDGTSTATQFTEGTAPSEYHGLKYTHNTTWKMNTAYSVSVYLKNGTRDYATLAIHGSNNNAVAVEANLTNGTISRTAVYGFTLDTYTIRDAGNGWYRVTLTATTNTSVSQPWAYIAASNGSTFIGGRGMAAYNGDGSSTFSIWGVQIEERSQPTAYIETVSRAKREFSPVMQSAGSNVPRFNHNPLTGESLGLLVENTRNNFHINTTPVGGSGTGQWTGTIYTNYTVSPSGNVDAAYYRHRYSNDYTQTFGSVSTAAVRTYTVSLFIKQLGANCDGVRMYFHESTAGNRTEATFNFDGTVSGAFGAGSFSYNHSSMTEIANGWWRATLTGTSDGSSTNLVFNIRSKNNTDFDESNGFLFWGTQMEVADRASSLIFTSGSAVSRFSDQPVMLDENVTSWFKNDYGTFVMHVDQPQVGANGVRYLRALPSNNDGSNRFIDVYKDGTTGLFNYSNTDGIQGAGFSLASGVDSGDIKFAISYSSVEDRYIGEANGNSATIVNGQSYMSEVSQIDIATIRNNTTNEPNAHVKKLAYYPVVLTEAQMKALTEE